MNFLRVFVSLFFFVLFLCFFYLKGTKLFFNLLLQILLYFESYTIFSLYYLLFFLPIAKEKPCADFIKQCVLQLTFLNKIHALSQLYMNSTKIQTCLTYWLILKRLRIIIADCQFMLWFMLSVQLKTLLQTFCSCHCT